MSTLLWVLTGILAYTAVAMWLRNRGVLPESVSISGPLATVHTLRGRAFLERLAGPKRFWRAVANLGLGGALVAMVGSFLLIVTSGLSALAAPQPSAVQQPQNFLIIPGVNEFLPLSVALEIVIGLGIAMVVHEGAHGLLCYVEDIEVESMGLVFFAMLPVGAFVEPNEEATQEASRGARSRMFAAGVTANTLLTIVVFALLFGPVVGAMSVAPGFAVGEVYPGSPAAAADITDGDRIIEVDGDPVADAEAFEAAIHDADADVTVTVDDGDAERQTDVARELQVVGSAGNNPLGISIEPGGTAIDVESVDGEPVRTEREFFEAVGDAERATVDTDATDPTEVPIGAYIVGIQEDGPIDEAGAPLEEPMTIVAIDGDRIRDDDDLAEVLTQREAGETVEVAAYTVDDERTTYDVELDAHPNREGGYVGVNIFPGTSGIALNDFGVDEYPAGAYLSLLGGDGGEGSLDGVGLGQLTDSPLGLVFVTLILPLGSLFGLPYNFAGFTGDITNFYVLDGSLAILGGGVFVLANLLFWTGWINIQLALFNCLPAFPLDGGRILRMVAEAVTSRLPLDNRHAAVRAVTVSSGLIMLFGLIVMIFGNQIMAALGLV